VNDRMITEPGIYDLDGDIYHADPTETASLSAGMINDILEAPAKCFYNSQRLNQDYEEPDTADKFTIGTVSHVIFLEPHLFKQRVVVADFDDWRKNEAKALRRDAKAVGKVAILTKHMDQVLAARQAFMRNGFVKDAFSDGRFEQSMFWRHPTYGFWCRARPDFIADKLAHLCDYKATANANPEQFGRHAYNMGYHRRAAWYLEGIRAIFGKQANHYWFVSQEIKPPYLSAVCELDWQALEAGQDENNYAAGIFAQCLEANDWPGYRDRDHPSTDRAFRVGIPTYAYMQIDQRLGRSSQMWPSPGFQQPEYEGIK
jgi:hypothetical protein